MSLTTSPTRAEQPQPAPHDARERHFSGYALAAAIAVMVFLLSYDGGSYDLVSRHSVAVIAWWAALLVVAFRVSTLIRPPGAVVVTGGLLAAFTAWTGLSMAWSDSAERTFLEFDRAALYLAIFGIAAAAPSRATIDHWLDGIAIGITGVMAVALADRFLPDLFDASDLVRFLPGAVTRLHFPVSYWNALAVLFAVGIPLLLRAALDGRQALRGVALAPLPAFAAALYLTSSRTGVAASAIGGIVFLAVVERRWPALGAALTALAGSVAAVAVLLDRKELVNGPLDSAAAADQGGEAALLITLICVVTGVVYALGCRFVLSIRPRNRYAELVPLVVVLAAVAVGIAAADPVARLRQFKAPPTAAAEADSDYVTSHLLSAGGNGRWQLWESAVDQWREAPAWGIGAGSYETWWTEHGTMQQFVRDAHSLYLEVLGELGLIGFALLVGAFASALVAALLRVRRCRERSRLTLAAALGSFAAFALAAVFDWMWEMTVVSIVGVAMLGFLVGRATSEPNGRPAKLRSTRAVLTIAGGAAAVALTMVVAQAIPLLATVEIGDSQRAAARGDLAEAIASADNARAFQPWAASPYLQLALVEEEADRLRSARRFIGEAIKRDRSDWRLWLVAARLETKLGAGDAARASLARAVRLNPRSPLLASFKGLRMTSGPAGDG